MKKKAKIILIVLGIALAYVGAVYAYNKRVADDCMCVIEGSGGTAHIRPNPCPCPAQSN